MLNGRKIVLGVTGGIAAYKACTLVSMLKKANAEIDVIMTKNATEFVNPITFEALSGRPVIIDTFKRYEKCEISHISLAKKAELFIVAPATANIIGKYANGIADDMLSTTLMATKSKIMFAPAMNTQMYNSFAVQNNLTHLISYGTEIIEGDSGYLACGDIGKGRMAEPEIIFKRIEEYFNKKSDFNGLKILITAGATIEKIDGVRYITNYSSGKMGVAIAEAARNRGANVTLILGRHTINVPYGINVINVETTSEMFEAVMGNISCNDIIIKAAAPCDYKPIQISEQKIKSDSLHLDFTKNKDIAAEVGKIKGNKKLIVFCAETENLIYNAKLKLKNKNADLIIANDVTMRGAGFNVDTNIVSIINKQGDILTTPMLPKTEIANIILDNIKKLDHDI